MCCSYTGRSIPKIDPERLTQVGGALRELGIRTIPAWPLGAAGLGRPQATQPADFLVLGSGKR